MSLIPRCVGRLKSLATLVSRSKISTLRKRFCETGLDSEHGLSYKLDSTDSAGDAVDVPATPCIAEGKNP